jgi:hypothetical protein
MRSLFRLLSAGTAAAAIATSGSPAAAQPLRPNVDASWVGWGLVGNPTYGYSDFYGYGYYPSGYGTYGYGGPNYSSGYRWVYLFPIHRAHRRYRH